MSKLMTLKDYLTNQDIFRARMLQVMKHHDMSLSDVMHETELNWITVKRFLVEEKEVKFQTLFVFERFLEKYERVDAEA